MSGWRFDARTVVEEHDAAVAANHYSDMFPRFDEAYRGLIWVLARRCDRVIRQVRGFEGTEYCLYVQAADPVANTPRITVIYTFTDDQLTIISIKAERPT